MRIFEIVKENVNLREAAELYGIDVNRYTDITELTPELLWTFIERIDIGERPGRYNRNGMQEVRIIYRDIGVVDSTMSAEDAESAEVHFIPSLEMVVQQMAAQTQVS